MPRLVGGAQIECIVPLGFQPILDFTVRDTHCYESQGVISHNCGKTLAGTYEDTLHLTGLYPDWWPGRRFSCPTDGWVAGDTNSTTRDILQRELLGEWDDFGTGMIPYDCIIDWTRKSGVPDAVDTVLVRHVSGGVSRCQFKAYSEGRKNFQGQCKHWVHFDEECSADVYGEALMRTMVTPGDERGGLCYLSFTPLSGWSDVVSSFLGEDSEVA
jgi:phage terminase large subunit-like protein